MEAAHNGADVKRRNGRDDDVRNALSRPFTDSEFLSLRRL